MYCADHKEDCSDTQSDDLGVLLSDSSKLVFNINSSTNLNDSDCKNRLKYTVNVFQLFLIFQNYDSKCHFLWSHLQ